MRSDLYKELFLAENLMGPNSIRLLDELLTQYPLQLTRENLVLDLGCGTGLTSLFIARETGATVYANDLWISEEANLKRFTAWNMQDQLIPVCEDANNLHFQPSMFDALVSIDSYHYFGGKEGFFTEKILPIMKPGGIALMGIPGMKTRYDGQSEALLTDWLGEEAYMFQSADYWKRIIGEHNEVKEVRTWEMTSFEQPWQEWFATKHEYALGDLKVYESLIKPYTCFVGIMVRKW